MDPFVGEIRAVGFNFAPRDWAFCAGQLLPIRSYTALFSLLGTQYGGNGTTTFGLPDLRGRAIVHVGQGPGLSNYVVGQTSGTENVTLQLTEMPAHTHGLTAAAHITTNSTAGTQTSPANGFLADSGTVTEYGEESDGTLMAPGMITGTGSMVGGNTAHSNMMPYLVTNYVIALQGIFPQRP